MKKLGKIILLVVIFVLLIPIKPEAATVKLSTKKVVLECNEKFTVKVLNVNKKVKWNADSDIIALKANKHKAKITAKLPGECILSAKIGKVTLKCRIKILKSKFSERIPQTCYYETQMKCLSWGKVAGADGYVIYKKLRNGKYIKYRTTTNGYKTYYIDSKSKTKNMYPIFKVKAYRRVNGKLIYSKARIVDLYME